MTMTIAELPTSVPLGPALTEGQAREIFRQGEEAVVFALLSLAKQLAEQQPSAAPVVTPTTPSAMVPSFLKPAADGRRKRPGRKAGHPGARRPTPERIDRQVDHRLEQCPTCQGPLTRQPVSSPCRTAESNASAWIWRYQAKRIAWSRYHICTRPPGLSFIIR